MHLSAWKELGGCGRLSIFHQLPIRSSSGASASVSGLQPGDSDSQFHHLRLESARKSCRVPAEQQVRRMVRVALQLANGSGDGLLPAGGSQDVESRELRVAIPVTVAGICAMGLAGNGLLLAVLLGYARRGRSSLIHGLLASLGAADLLVLLLCAPLRAAAWSRSSWVLGRFVCRTSDWFLHGCLAAKAFTGAALAKAGLVYVSRSPKAGPGAPLQRWRVATLLVGLWALAFSLPLPHWIFTSVRLQASGRRLCVAQAPGGAFPAVYSKLYPLLVYGAPVLCSLSFHCQALRRCRRHGGTATVSPAHKLRNQLRGRRLVVLSSSLSLAFAALCAPEWVVWLWLRHSPQRSQATPPVALALLAQLLVLALSFLDPLLFAALSDEFREEFPGLWKKLISRRPRIPAPTAPRTRESGGSGARSDPVQPRQEKSVQVPEPDQESPASKAANLVLTDMEQFWHDRQNIPAAAQEDPIPWEHQSETPCPEI
ncbi:G-protein coupled receptor 151 [Stegostoma tigrinum]|uniref:G-protein coupled receptor 151 n=1 Tax=Stegostoma tigrinum TaxID=3053191 RepID=UPI00202B9F7F|nr:G-protein coupled receptor 151 [Stegostoma tigrinum]